MFPASGIRLFYKALDFLLPPRCFSCGEASTIQGPLCAQCWGELVFISEPTCAICGYPFAFDDRQAYGQSLTCAACLRKPPPYDRARAPLIYNDKSKRMILALKYNDNFLGLNYFASLMAVSVPSDFQSADFILPIPIHWRRLLSRRYNQAAVLAHALSKKLGIKILPRALERHRHTPPQGSLNHSARRKNVARAFSISSNYLNLVHGSHVILVDDVLTTGATVEECAKLLRQAGAKQIDVITVARVLHPQKILV